MRLHELNYERIQAYARMKDISMRQALEQATRDFYEALPDDEKELVGQLIEKAKSD